MELPDSEIEYGTFLDGDIVRVNLRQADRPPATGHDSRDISKPNPPVSVGETYTVEIEDMGDQANRIARVDRGYVLIVPDTEPGDEVTVEVHETMPNYGFATVVEDQVP